MRSPLLPPPSTAAKLFATGATVGPLVDSLHNQCLLAYDIAPVSLAWGNNGEFSLSTSWLIPPLLGVAYVVLGGVLPRLSAAVLPFQSEFPVDETSVRYGALKKPPGFLRNRALVAVSSTALIIRLSEILQTNPLARDNLESGSKLLVMSFVAVLQWAALDATPAALLAAMVTCVGGPLSELPFVASGCWHYLPESMDYFPLEGFRGGLKSAVEFLLGDGSMNLGLSSITGPCYFAVTMDAIALGRWFDEDIEV